MFVPARLRVLVKLGENGNVSFLAIFFVVTGMIHCIKSRFLTVYFLE